MNFKEYIEYQEKKEDFDLFISLNENDFLSAMSAVPKFLAGAAGNVVGQGLRGVANITQGGLSTGAGLAKTGVGALQYVGGNKEGRKKAIDKMKSGISGVGRGIGSALRGATQIVSTPVTAPIRGAQAVDDSIGNISGVFSPGDPKRTYWQDLFGLDSGDRKQEPVVKEPVAQTQTQQVSKNSPKTPRTAKPEGIPQEWYDLTDRLRKASSAKEGAAIAAEMAKKYPVLYDAARKKAMSLSRGRPSTNPSGQLRSGTRRRAAGFPGL